MALPTAFLVGPVASAEPGEQPVAGQLRALGYDVVDTSTAPDLATAISTAPAGRIALVDRRYIGHLHALRRAVCDSRPDALAGPGTLTVAYRFRGHLVTALAGVPAASGGTAASGGCGARPVGEEVDVAEVADVLARRLSVTRLDPAPLVAGLADSVEERAALQARMAAVDEERIRLTSSVKSGDTAFTTFAVRPYSGHVARWFAKLGITPDQVTILSLLVALGAVASCATGTRLGWVLGALLFHLSFVLDCVDGDLARYTVRFSQLGARLDLTVDRVKEYALFAGLAFGVASTDGGIWWLAGAAMALQTLRHHMHFAWDAVVAGLDAAPPLAAQVQARLRGGRWKVWLRRAVVLPQGERSALTCLLVAFTTPRTVFVVLLVVGVLAAAYAFLGRLLRSVRRVRNPWSKTAGRSLGAMIDVGPVGWLVHNALPGRSLPAPLTTLIALIVLAFSLAVVPSVGGSWVIVGVLWYALLVGFASQQPLNGWADWVLPPSFRAAEYTLAFALAALLEPRALPAAFAYVAVCAFHHYDTVYRLRADGSVPPRWLVIATGGHDGRMLVLALLILVGGTVFYAGLIALTAVLTVLFVAESVHGTLAVVRAAESRTPQEAAR